VLRDHYLGFSTLYYATPWGVLWGLAVALVVGALISRQRRMMIIWTAVAVVLGLMWGGTSFQHRARPAPAGALRVITWNMAHGAAGLAREALRLRELNPDLAGIVEADPAGVDVKRVFVEAFPEYHVARMGGGMMFVSRWPTGQTTPHLLGRPEDDCRAREIDVQTPWGSWTCIVVDLGSNPCYSRQRAIADLAGLVERLADRPVIVLGDFNTPLDSVHYRALAQVGLRELFQEVGSGYQPTWPVPAPVLSLDQIWINSQLTAYDCRRVWTDLSDHAAVAGSVVPGP
jgi:endonuclease/exonuclease/phosphatase family metal-dependent hydrolase